MTMRGCVGRLILLGSLCSIAPSSAAAVERPNVTTGCFSVVVGRSASADGSVMFAHNEDAIAPAVNLYKVPRGTHVDGGQESPGYLWLNVTTCDVCATYVNECGVIIGSDGCPSREDKPELTNGGILFWLRRLAVEKARSAREAVRIAGGLISEWGYADGGRSYIIADADEAWILAAVNGKHWVAQRVPDDKVALIPNSYTIQGIDLRDTVNFLGSPDIIEYAIKRGWYDPARDGEFDFARAYATPGSMAHPGNTHRTWRAIDLLSGEKREVKHQMPFAITPSNKLSQLDLMRVLSDRYAGTVFGEPVEGTICHDGTMYSVVAQLRSWLPAEIKSIAWIALYRPELQAYGAWYPSITTAPVSYALGDHLLGLQEQLDRSIVGHKKDRSPAYATFVALDEKVRAHSSTYMLRVKEAWASYQDESFKEQSAFEKEIVSHLKKDRQKAVQLITDHTARKAMEMHRKADELLRSLDSHQDP